MFPGALRLSALLPEHLVFLHGEFILLYGELCSSGSCQFCEV